MSVVLDVKAQELLARIRDAKAQIRALQQNPNPDAQQLLVAAVDALIDEAYAYYQQSPPPELTEFQRRYLP